jgi:GMP reductase
MLAGHDQGGGDIIEEVYETNQMIIDPDTSERLGKLEERKKFVQFYGMSSETAMEKHHGGVAEYRSSEGRTVRVPYKGSVTKTVQDILGGVRSTCTYVGAKSIKDLSKCTTFVRVNKQFNDVYLRK